jgi:excinuclease ABC subunit A
MGHTVLVIEHDLDVIERADHLIEIGPKGGEEGGELLFTGAPENISSVLNSPTAHSISSKK